ncbi:MAG TPA: cupredoxin domain-containing protein [Solirubrobacteraceae bacterium]|nr:cupredoxin domain-containing protein [Solirubrobacteraceae bacterium]
MLRARAVSRLLILGAASLALATTLTACGHTTTVGASRIVRIAVTEYRVVPQSIRARAGRLTLVVENDGRLAHTLAISRHGNILGQTMPLAPGTTAPLTLSLGPGSYLMSSTLFSDQALGLYGTLTVVR